MDELPLALSDLSIDDIVYVADEHLRVVFVNHHWNTFASENRGRQAFKNVGQATLLDSFSGSERSRWQGIYQALIEGRLSVYETEFLCPSPSERRVFKLRVERHDVKTAGGLLLVHRLVRRTDKGPTSDEQTVAAYNRLVGHRPLAVQSFSLASSLEPLAEVGGDLLWSRTYSNDKVDLVIADAVGHGIVAARTALCIAAMLDQHTEECAPVASNVANLNAHFSAQAPAAAVHPTPTVAFATGLYVRIDRHKQTTTVCSFGHPGAIFSKAGYVPPPPGLPVGIRSDGVWSEQEFGFAEYGGQILLFTDGVTEQFDADGRMFGPNRLADLFVSHLSLPPAQRLQTLRRELAAFRGSALVKDDQALLVVDAQYRGG